MNSKTTLKCILGIGTIAKRYQAYSTFQGIVYSKQYLVHNIDTVLMRSEQSAGEKQSKENKYTLEWIINIGRYCIVHLIEEMMGEDTGEKGGDRRIHRNRRG